QVIHYSSGFPGLFWVAGAGWVSQFYYDYWLYTGDRLFLEQQALPFMLESAAVYEDFPTVERNGKYVFLPSYSPEVNPLGHANVVPNATMDVAVVKQLLRNLIALSKDVEIDSRRIAKWKQMLAKLPAYETDSKGSLKEWIWPGLENNDEHRHASHLYPLYDGVDPELAASAELRAAASRAIDNRLSYRRSRNGAIMSFGLTQKGLAAAHLRDKRLAYECVEWMANSFWTTGMVSLHNPKQLFNLDISGGLPAVIIEMLMQSTPDGEIHLLPVLPDEWADGEITGIRARGGFEIDLVWRDGKLHSGKLRSLLGRTCKIVYRDKTLTLETEKGKSYDIAL
ncbi:MAG: glycoside hydrolase family 95 protein, partial [bacterium]|nr:glycoside hydrolase family 95 protein [bacterium]